MSIQQRLRNDLKVAMKAGDRLRVDCLRMLRARILEREVALRAERGLDYQLSDDETVQVLSTYGKQRRDSIESYRKGGREDLAAKEEAELAILDEYLPRRLSEAEVAEIVRQAIAECGASSPREIGAVMQLVMPRLRGAADGKLVNRLVREALAKAGS